MSSPVYALYARPIDLKEYLVVEDVVDDARILRCCKWASRQIDRITGRHFYPKVETVSFDVPDDDLSELMFGRDLVSVTTLTNGDDTAITSGQYFLYPTNGPPYAWLELDTSQGICWQYASTRNQCIDLAGIWGWDEITEAVDTLDAAYTADGTSITPSDMSLYALGDLLKIGTDYLYVTAIGVDTLTIEPGANGATSAGHDDSSVISRISVPDDIKEIACRLAAWRHKQRDGIFESTANAALGTVTIPASVPPDIKAELQWWTR